MSVSRENIDEILSRESRNGEILVGFVGVDSGQIIITDPCYLKDWKHFESTDPKKPFDHPDGDYEKLLELGGDEAYQVPAPILHGFSVLASTDGDGSFPVYATFVQGRVVSLRIQLGS